MTVMTKMLNELNNRTSNDIKTMQHTDFHYMNEFNNVISLHKL